MRCNLIYACVYVCLQHSNNILITFIIVPQYAISEFDYRFALMIFSAASSCYLPSIVQVICRVIFANGSHHNHNVSEKLNDKCVAQTFDHFH